MNKENHRSLERYVVSNSREWGARNATDAAPHFAATRPERGAEVTELLNIYLQNLRVCARKKHRRCIAQELAK